MNHDEAAAFAGQWVEDWNNHDVEAVLAHFTDDVVFTSPLAAGELVRTGHGTYAGS